VLLPLLPLLIAASAATGPGACVKPPSELPPRTSSLPVVRRYKIANSCPANVGRVAVFVICDRRKFDVLFLDVGEEKIWSCESGDGYGPGKLSIDVKSVK
jgi:hypothetical protein